MKKIYALAMAAFLAAPAVAAIPSASKTAFNADAPFLSLSEKISNMPVAKPSMKKAPAKAVSSVADLCHVYDMTYWYPFQGDDPFKEKITPVASKGEGENEIVFIGMPYMDVELRATVDMAAKTVSFAQQDVIYIPEQGDMLIMQPQHFDVAEDGAITPRDISAVVAKIQDDGSLLFDEWDVIALVRASNHARYNWAAARITMNNLPYYKIDLSEWTEVGESQYTDATINYGFAEQYRVGTVPVKTFVKNGNNNLIALQNPYLQGDWAERNPANDLGAPDGYVVFDISNPDCVPMADLCGSGMYIDNAEEGATEPAFEQCYLINRDGVAINREGQDIQDYIDEMIANENAMSSYTASTRTVDLIGVYFGLTSAPTSLYYFNEDSTLKVVLPDMAGVEGVEADSNVAPKYYNLQGMEVKNPAAGELVIVKKGSKTFKTIAK